MQRWKLTLAPGAWKLLCAATRLDPPGPPPQMPEPCIFACLHRDILPAIMYVRRLRPVLMVSNSPDGDILVRTLGAGNYGFVRGASGENGGRAFVELRRLVESGRSAGVAVDGPRGPYGVVHEGVLQLARLTGCAIVPLLARPRRAVVLDTWDRTVVPWPFSRVEMLQAPPLHLDRQAGAAEMATARQRLSDWFTPGEERT